jgi:hypothetical protein
MVIPSKSAPWHHDADERGDGDDALARLYVFHARSRRYWEMGQVHDRRVGPKKRETGAGQEHQSNRSSFLYPMAVASSVSFGRMIMANGTVVIRHGGGVASTLAKRS